MFEVLGFLCLKFMDFIGIELKDKFLFIDL